MAKTWVLNTSTKGTGANVVPLGPAAGPIAPREPLSVPRRPRPPEPKAPPPRPPHKFRVTDVMTRQNLADDASAAQAVAVLRGVRSTVDVTIYVWQEESGRWRRLTFPEQRVMFDLAAEQVMPVT
jgi:hypothetical protein